MTNDLNFKWDKEEHSFLVNLAKNNNANTMKDLEYYLDFLSEIESSKEIYKKDKTSNIKFTL